MSLVTAGWALSATWLLGALLLSATRLFPKGGWHRAVSGFCTGAFVIGFVGTVVVALNIPLRRTAVYAIGLTLSVPAGVQWWSGYRGLAGMNLGWNMSVDRRELLWRGLALAAVVAVGLVLVAGTQDRLWWDGWAIWGFKAKVLFVENGLPSTLRDMDGPYVFTHLDYPLGLPLLGWWLYEHAGVADPALLSTLGAVLFGLTVAGVWAALRTRSDRRIAAGVTLGTAAFWPVSYYAIGATADVVVALVLVGVATEIQRFIEERDQTALWRSGIYLGLAALTKNEGLALSLGALAIVGVWANRRRREWTPALAMLIPLLALVPWAVFRQSHGLTGDQLSLPTVTTVLERIPTLVRGLGILLTNVEWVALPFLAGFGVLAAWKHRQPGPRVGWALLGVYFTAICAVYVVSPREIVWLLNTSLPRVLGALVPATVLLTALSVFPSAGARSVSARSVPGPAGNRHE